MVCSRGILEALLLALFPSEFDLEYNWIDFGHQVPMLMMYSILNKLGFENMAQNQISVSRRNAVKTWVVNKFDEKYSIV